MLPETQALIDAAEWIEERAAIMEYDGGLTRADAEQAADVCWMLRSVPQTPANARQVPAERTDTRPRD